MKIPKEVGERIAVLEKNKREFHEAKRRHEAAERKRQQKLAAERRARSGETRKYADAISHWRLNFLDTPEAKRIWRVLGQEAELTIFTTTFWLCEPCALNDRVYWAALSLAGPRHDFLYSEWHKGYRSVQGDPMVTGRDLAKKLHPDFLKQLFEHLIGPDAWRHILLELNRR